MSARASLAGPFRIVFRLTVGLFAAICAFGVLNAILRERSLPGIAQEYGTEVRRLIAARQYDRAARQMHLALALDHALPKSQGRLVLAQVLARSGKLDEAIAEYRSIAAADPHNADVHSELGGALAARGDFAAAVGSLQRALELDPARRDIASRLAWAEGSALRGRGQLDAATQRFRDAVAAQPELVEARYDLAITLAAMGRLAECEQELQTLLQARPDPRAYNALGMIYAQTGRRAEAAEAFQRGLALAPNDTELRQNARRLGSR